LSLKLRFGALFISSAHEDNFGRRTFNTPSSFVYSRQPDSVMYFVECPIR
jgi:hypothetical protein